MGGLMRLLFAGLAAAGRMAAGEPPCCSHPGCCDTRLSVDPDGGAGGLCSLHGGIRS